jgi:hypothetical protein
MTAKSSHALQPAGASARAMLRNAPRFVSLVAALFVFQGCSVFDASPSRPGMSRRETAALVETYYWQRHFPTPSYTESSLDTLLARSADPTLDGASAEGQASAVAVALSVVGDQRFAEALTRQPRAVRAAVGRNISSLWRHYRLHYPQTQALLP